MSSGRFTALLRGIALAFGVPGFALAEANILHVVSELEASVSSGRFTALLRCIA